MSPHWSWARLQLFLAPALVVGLLWLFGAAPGMTSNVSVIEAAMPPMIGAGIVAAQANLAPRLVSLMIGLGIPLGLGHSYWLALAVRRSSELRNDLNTRRYAMNA